MKSKKSKKWNVIRAKKQEIGNFKVCYALTNPTKEAPVIFQKIKVNMKQIITSIWEVAKREVYRMSSRPLYILAVVVFPLLSILFFASLFKEGVPTKMPIAIVDLDNTVTSRKIARNIDVTQLSMVTMNLQ